MSSYSEILLKQQEISLKWRDSLSSGDVANLRRCRTCLSAQLTPSFAKLRYAMLAADGRTPRDEEIALVAILLCTDHLNGGQKASSNKESAQNSNKFTALLKHMAAKDRVSSLRFRRIITLDRDNFDSRLLAMRRLRKMLGDRKSDRNFVGLLVQANFSWNDYTKRDWALGYFAPTSSNS